MIAASDRVHVATRASDSRPQLDRTGRGRRSTVHSCFRSAVNISTPDGLLTIASDAVGGLPNGIVADPGPDFRTLGIAPGMGVDGDSMQVSIPEARFRLDLSAAVPWSPRLVRSSSGADHLAARWRRRSAEARSIALQSSTAGGLAGLLEPGRIVGPTRSFDATERARPAVTALAEALADDDRLAAAGAAHELVGLGPGLTPSGDDMLVGLEAALHALGAPGRGFLAAAVADVDVRTTGIAGTLLRYAACGEFAERVHRLLDGLLGPDDRDLRSAIERATAWGATSGTDCLVGVLYGLDLAARPKRTLPA